MLLCKLTKSGEIELTDKKTTIVLGNNEATLGDQVFNSPGEYEHSGVEIVYGANALLLVWERLQIVYAFSVDAPTGFEKTQFSSCDVLIFDPTEGEISKTTLTPLTDAYDPSVIIFGAKPIEAATKDTLKIQAVDQVKLAAQTLPTEGRDSFQLGS